MMRAIARRLPWRSACAAVLLAATHAAAAGAPARVAIVRPAHPDALADEAATRLQAELLAAGFVVVLVDPAPGADPGAELATDEAPSRPVAAVAIVRVDHRVAADVWIADRAAHQTVVRRVDADATAESSRPAALAVRSPQDEGPCSAAQDDTGDDTLIATAGNDGGSARAPRTHGCASKLQPPKGSAEEYATWQSGACD